MHALLLLAFLVGVIALASTYRREKMPLKHMVVAVMGPTGSGKSSFIKEITGSRDIIIGHDLSSSTKEVNSYDFKHEDIVFTLVDTPGFDDTDNIDQEIVQNILQWLQRLNSEQTRLDGLIYFHRIIDPRLTGSARSNMRLFRKLCGEDNMPNVVLVTTFWDQVEASLGNRREMILRTDPQFWAPMIKKGSKVVRVLDDRESKLQLLTNIAKNNRPSFIQAQREMMSGTSLEETAAARSFGLDELAKTERELASNLARERQQLQKYRQEQERKKQAEIERRANDRRAFEERHREQLRRRAEQEEAELKKQELREEKLRKARQAEIDRLRRAMERQRRAQQELEQQRRWEAKVCTSQPRKRHLCNWCEDRLDGDGLKSFEGRWAYREYLFVPPFRR